MVAGVDGCKKGWVVVSKQPGENDFEVHVCETIEKVAALKADITAIDIPIGLLKESGRRQCDIEARKMLKPKRYSSVFYAPPKGYLGKDYDELRVKGFSRQSYGIFPKIMEVDDFLCTNPKEHRRFHEVHPELCFWKANGEKSMQFSKKSLPGVVERINVLKQVGFTQIADITSIREVDELAGVAVDDLLDAAIACWTAERVYNWMQDDDLVGILPENANRQDVLENPLEHPAIWY